LTLVAAATKPLAMADPFADLRGRPCCLGPSRGARRSWHQGRSPYLIWALRLRSPALRQRLWEVQQALASALVPADSPHITLWACGFPAEEPQRSDDLGPSALAEQHARLGPWLDGPIAVEVGGAGAFASCAFLQVVDQSGRLQAARAALESLGSDFRTGPYVPHVTAGLFRASLPSAPLLDALAPFAGLPPLALSARIELCAIDPRRFRGALRPWPPGAP
jgi:2'-5' RNA ligase